MGRRDIEMKTYLLKIDNLSCTELCKTSRHFVYYCGDAFKLLFARVSGSRETFAEPRLTHQLQPVTTLPGLGSLGSSNS